ncbi:unnamed protein product [Chrysoparadoxa australica]
MVFEVAAQVRKDQVSEIAVFLAALERKASDDRSLLLLAEKFETAIFEASNSYSDYQERIRKKLAKVQEVRQQQHQQQQVVPAQAQRQQNSLQQQQQHALMQQQMLLQQQQQQQQALLVQQQQQQQAVLQQQQVAMASQQNSLALQGQGQMMPQQLHPQYLQQQQLQQQQAQQLQASAPGQVPNPAAMAAASVVAAVIANTSVGSTNPTPAGGTAAAAVPQPPAGASVQPGLTQTDAERRERALTLQQANAPSILYLIENVKMILTSGKLRNASRDSPQVKKLMQYLQEGTNAIKYFEKCSKQHHIPSPSSLARLESTCFELRKVNTALASMFQRNALQKQQQAEVLQQPRSAPTPGPALDVDPIPLKPPMTYPQMPPAQGAAMDTLNAVTAHAANAGGSEALYLDEIVHSIEPIPLSGVSGDSVPSAKYAQAAPYLGGTEMAELPLTDQWQPLAGALESLKKGEGTSCSEVLNMCDAVSALLEPEPLVKVEAAYTPSPSTASDAAAAVGTTNATVTTGAVTTTTTTAAREGQGYSCSLARMPKIVDDLRRNANGLFGVVASELRKAQEAAGKGGDGDGDRDKLQSVRDLLHKAEGYLHDLLSACNSLDAEAKAPAKGTKRKAAERESKLEALEAVALAPGQSSLQEPQMPGDSSASLAPSHEIGSVETPPSGGGALAPAANADELLAAIKKELGEMYPVKAYYGAPLTKSKIAGSQGIPSSSDGSGSGSGSGRKVLRRLQVKFGNMFAVYVAFSPCSECPMPSDVSVIADEEIAREEMIGASAGANPDTPDKGGMARSDPVPASGAESAVPAGTEGVASTSDGAGPVSAKLLGDVKTGKDGSGGGGANGANGMHDWPVSEHHVYQKVSSHAFQALKGYLRELQHEGQEGSEQGPPPQVADGHVVAALVKFFRWIRTYEGMFGKPSLISNKNLTLEGSSTWTAAPPAISSHGSEAFHSKRQ